MIDFFLDFLSGVKIYLSLSPPCVEIEAPKYLKLYENNDVIRIKKSYIPYFLKYYSVNSLEIKILFHPFWIKERCEILYSRGRLILISVNSLIGVKHNINFQRKNTVAFWRHSPIF